MKLPIRGKDKFETVQNLTYILIIIGAFVFSIGVGLTIMTPKGLSVAIAMIGSFTLFISTVVLIFTWLAKELFGA